MILIGCCDGLTAEQAARIAIGLCLGTLGAVMTLAAAALAWDTWSVWRRDGQKKDDFNKETD